ncbi:NapC/NirT family cytochrome c [Selenihalanaerobacter shriftii]|uniref:Trimethylamine-N-oxide reductase (Cytochrome c), cytochrome c-type subunit TorC n=1 Tax=Selenihalanaerobacter shriftii TaxID=142842 RepID=A0A1T4LT59_9FIRM|nr:NapC/NirT family cytochrome c [Selenihalanaerobacter shriftii]SJZ57929.1 trimethylamine-N-oxide reductase (cytochrome c), cytochrome c-type subunit TorC [Selenihalanaerobacter shriftii]
MAKDYLNWKVLIGALIVLGIVGFGTIKYTERPEFCTSCHEIQPAYNSWSTSTHDGVNCMECHADPGTLGLLKRKLFATKEIYKHITGQTENIEGEVPGERCLECHEEIGELKEIDQLNIPHQKHLDANVECAACHENVVHGSAGYRRPGMKVCSKCHDVYNPNKCTKCHQKVN